MSHPLPFATLLSDHRSELVDEATLDACWSLILKQMYRDRADRLASALTRCCSLRDVRAFFDELAIRKPNW